MLVAGLVQVRVDAGAVPGRVPLDVGEELVGGPQEIARAQEDANASGSILPVAREEVLEERKVVRARQAGRAEPRREPPGER